MGEPRSDGRKNNGQKTGEPHAVYPNTDSLIPLANWRQAKLKLRRDKVIGGHTSPRAKSQMVMTPSPTSRESRVAKRGSHD